MPGSTDMGKYGVTHQKGILPYVFLGNSVVEGVHSFAWAAAIVSTHF